MAAESSRLTYQWLVAAAVVGTIAWVGWGAYDSLVLQKAPGDYAYHAGSNFFADGHFTRALEQYEEALAEVPEHFAAQRGRAEALIQLGRESEAIVQLNGLIAIEPKLGALYANLGIAHDRLGEHEQALSQYETALRLDPEIGDGPSWITRFLRNQAEKPPGIAARAMYLREQLALPAGERLLKVPEVDAAQRPHKP